MTVTLSYVRVATVTGEFTLEELADSVRQWCERHRVLPANGQAAEEISERNIRYYRTIGLLDPPLGNYIKTFSHKHRLQLIAIRLFQAQGLPLRKIRDELYGKSLQDLLALEKRASRSGKENLAFALPFQPSDAVESWSVIPLNDEFLLVSRKNKPVPRTIVKQIAQLLRSAHPENQTTQEPSRN